VSPFVLERVQVLPRPREEVFRFFEDAANLERLTPPFLNFRIETPGPIDMAEGTLIDYRLSLFGVPFGWRTRIVVYEPKDRFVDAQLRGPYKLWRHTHTFEDAVTPAGAGTQMTDRVEYELPLGPLGHAARALFVRATLEKIFDFRRDAIAALFADESKRAA
jgi:ligand-binding SRPBCC domain-containing protein